MQIKTLNKLFTGLLIVLWSVVISMPFFAMYGYHKRTQEGKQDNQRLEKFLVDHGDVVTLISLQDEMKNERYGKSFRTVDRAWFNCKFKDGYIVEIEQRHGHATTRIPQIGERWRIRSHVYGDRGQFYFYQKVE